MLAALALLSPVALDAQMPANFPTEIADFQTIMTVRYSFLRQSYAFAIGGQQVTIRRFERHPLEPDSETVSRQSQFSTSYYITDVCFRNGGDDLFLSGIKQDGTSIVERWKFRRRNGEYVVQYPHDPAPIGVPLPPYVPTITVKGGIGADDYSLPSPVLEPIPKRITLYEGPLGPFTTIEADPEGRFLLLWSMGDTSLYQLALESGATPALLMSSTGYPSLQQVNSIEVRDWPGTNPYRLRKYLLRKNHPGQVGEVFTILHDDDNDGVFDLARVESFDEATFKDGPWGVWEDWHLKYQVNDDL